MKPKHRNRRLGVIALVGVPLIIAGVITFRALEQSVSYFLTPTELAEVVELPTRPIRIGGLVVADSVVRGEGLETKFHITDGGADIVVVYNGILPDLFREGQGVIVEGSVLPDRRFEAHLVLAKHDENYVPKELQHTLKNKDVS